MQDKNEGIRRFLDACNELVYGKFILADSKISELLKAVAASEELTRLFDAVTSEFDFPAAKKEYLKSDARNDRGTAYLPSDRKELLAFVFCLLAEFDGGKVKLGDFLLRYFYEDGSYTASYSIFAERMIRPFRDIVRECYPEAERQGEMRRRREDELFGSLSEKLARERARVKGLPLSGEDAVAGDMILAELGAAAGRRDVPELKALLCGYLYFLGVTKTADENSNAIFDLAGELI